MKNLLFALVILSLVSCKTMQMGADASPDLLQHQEVFEFTDKTKDELYVIANEWFVDVFNSAESVIQYQDKEAGKILGKYVTDINISVYNYLVKSTISISVKENKVKIEFKDPNFKAISDNLGNSYNEDYKPLTKKDGAMKTKTNWLALSQSLKNHIDNYESW